MHMIIQLLSPSHVTTPLLGFASVEFATACWTAAAAVALLVVVALSAGVALLVVVALLGAAALWVMAAFVVVAIGRQRSKENRFR